MNVTKTPKVLWRQARSDDFDAAYIILRSAARRMVQQGRHQWDDSYPQKEDVQNDISLAQAYVLESDEKVVAYGVVSFDGEPAYDALYGGEWLSRGKYAVVHRMAVDIDERQSGLGTCFFEKVVEMCKERGVSSIKVDTNYDNVEMLALLMRLDFLLCGKVYYDRAGERIERLAFEKVL